MLILKNKVWSLDLITITLVFPVFKLKLLILDFDVRLLFCRDPFAAHRQQMRSMMTPFAIDPFALAPQMHPHRVARRQVTGRLVDQLKLI